MLPPTHPTGDQIISSTNLPTCALRLSAVCASLAIDTVQSGALLQSTGLSAGDAFSELGDLVLDGLSRPATS
jgi:hypothetical protein